MANANNPFGFRAISLLSGGPLQVNQYGKPASDTNYAIFQNDLLLKAAVTVAAAEGNAPGCASAQGGTPGTSLYLGSALNYGKISTDTLHLVMDDPTTIFIAQVDGSTSITTAAHVGKNANVLSGTGSATTKQSTMQVNHTGIATTSGLDLRILRISGIVPNAEGANAIVEVMILKHALDPGSAGV